MKEMWVSGEHLVILVQVARSHLQSEEGSTLLRTFHQVSFNHSLLTNLSRILVLQVFNHYLGIKPRIKNKCNGRAREKESRCFLSLRLTLH